MRRRGRIWADTLAAFPGATFRRPLNFKRWFAVHLNLGRQRLRWAWIVALGNGISRSSKRLPYAWFEALSETAEEAEELSFEVNARRMEARAERRGR